MNRLIWLRRDGEYIALDAPQHGVSDAAEMNAFRARQSMGADNKEVRLLLVDDFLDAPRRSALRGGSPLAPPPLDEENLAPIEPDPTEGDRITFESGEVFIPG